MKIDITIQQVKLDKKVSDRVLRRVQFALSKFGHSIRRVRVHFSDLNGPKGGNDKRCSIKVKLITTGEIVVQGVGKDIVTALSHSVERVERAIKRELEKRRETPIRRNRRLEHNKGLESLEDDQFSSPATLTTGAIDH